MTNESEPALLARCRQGDPAAWEELLDRHYPAVAGFVFQLAPDLSREDVEEVCQEVFVTVVRSLESFRGASAFQTWVCRIALNKARDFLERARAAKRGGGRPPLSLDADRSETGLAVDPPSGAPAPDETLARQEDAALLHEALIRLGDPCREIIELRYFADLSYEELATSLCLNVKTVSSRLSKCLDKLEDIARDLFQRETTGRLSV
ncbi:MAG: sigma-70 family RNA polymerase sigma factor [Verrucomicrobia bacterium]|jgi:RNA polymerase sigma-70 factor (ECF subfamily)|nr:sigma-70 family RNA polymerase sigma factor [Verrucomicrobiota bacterium]